MTVIEERLKHIAQKGKISGSWLFSGPFGVMKEAHANGLANYLATGKWVEDELFNPQIMRIKRGLTEEAKKEIQKTILAGKAVDEDAKNQSRKKEITVDDIRAGIQFLSLKPGANEYRILIVSLAEDMNINAANALLKMLEEPFERSVLILISENTGKLLPTICSRCRQIDFPPLDAAFIESVIAKEFPKLNAAAISDLANGSLGMARLIATENGLDVYQKLLSFILEPLSKISIENLNTYADFLNKDENAFKLFFFFLTDELSRQIKRIAALNPLQAENLSDLYFDTLQLFDKTARLNLDKKQNIITTILKIAGAINA